MNAISIVRRTRRQVPWAIIAFVVLGLAALPIVPLLVEVLHGGARGVRELFDYSNTGEIYFNTVMLGVGSMAFALLVGTSLALLVQNLAPRIRRFFMPLPLLVLLIPGAANVTGFVFLFSPEVGFVNKFLRSTPLFNHLTTGPVNIYTLPWIVAYTGFSLSAIVYLFVQNGIDQLGVTSLAAARVSGARPIRALFTVTLPMLRPVLIYAGSIVLLLALGQFTGPLFLGRREGIDVVSTEMYLLTQEQPIRFALGAAMGMPVLLVAIVAIAIQRRLLGNQERYVGSQARGELEVSSSRTGQLISGTVVLLYTTLSSVLALLALVVVATSSYWSGNLDFSQLSLDTMRKVLDDPVVRDSIRTTIFIAVGGGFGAVVLGFAAAYALFQRDRYVKATSSLLDLGVTAVLAMPGALLGFGFLFSYSRLGWYGKELGLMLAFATIGLPFAARYQLAGMVSCGELPVEAAMTSGAGLSRALRTVVMPLIRRSIAASAAIVLVVLTHEFGTSVMLRASPETTMMSVKLYDFYNGGLYPQVAAMAMLMTAVTAVVVFFALIAGSGRALRRDR